MGKAMIIIVLGLSVIVGSSMVSLDERSIQSAELSLEYYEDLAARNIAESAANIGLAKLAETPSWRSSLADSGFSGGGYTVAAADSGTNLVIITSTGNSGQAEKTITIRLKMESSSTPDSLVWTYASFAGDNIRDSLEVGAGVINGDIIAANGVRLHHTWTINGKISQNDSLPHPTVDWNFLKNQAISVGQDITGNITFTQSQSPYYGVWYAEGKITVEQNAEIYGTIVAESSSVKIYDGAIIIATPSNYPAVVADSDIDIWGDYVEITGFNYAADDIKFMGHHANIKGAIFAGDDIRGSLQGKKAYGGGRYRTITFDSTYVQNLQGIQLFGNSGSSSSSSSSSSGGISQLLSWIEYDTSH